MDDCVLTNESEQLSLVTISESSCSGMDKRSCHTQGPTALRAGLNFETIVFPSCAKEIFFAYSFFSLYPLNSVILLQI